MARSLDLLSEEGRNLILAGALISIVINPPLFRVVDRLEIRLVGRRQAVAAQQSSGPRSTRIQIHPPLTGRVTAYTMQATILQLRHHRSRHST